MPSARLQQQFIRLWQCCQGQSRQTTLGQLAALLGCSHRRMRALLQAMQQQGWLSWQAQAGRGKHSWLHFNYSGLMSQQQRIDELLEQDKIDQLYQQLDARQVARLLQASTGYSEQPTHTRLRLLSPCPLLNLLPGPGQQPPERHLSRQIFSGLLRIDPRNGQPQGDLAHHWQTINPLHWRFFLRPAVRFHHGRPLDSDDLITSIQRLQALPPGAHIRHISASPRTLDIHLSQPDSQLLALLSSDLALILPKESATLNDFSRLPVGTGPYRVSRNSREALTLQAFDDYFSHRALIDQISLWHLANPSALPAPVSSAHGQRCYSLLLDPRSPASPAHPWLRHHLTPATVFSQLPDAQQRAWQLAWRLLPGAPPPAREEPPAPGGLAHLRLACCQHNADLIVLSQAIARLLARHQITLDILPLPCTAIHQGQAQADIWLHELYSPPPVPCSLFSHLWQTPLLQACLPLDWQAAAQRWHAGTLCLDDWLTQCQRWLIPLFHLAPLPPGWSDFATAWPGHTAPPLARQPR